MNTVLPSKLMNLTEEGEIKLQKRGLKVPHEAIFDQFKEFQDNEQL